jgi:hypothetical protein
VGFFLLIGVSSGFAQKPNVPRHHGAATVQRKTAAVALPKAGGGANGADAQLKRLEQQTGKIAAAKPQKGNAAPVKTKAPLVGANKNTPIAFKAQPAQARGGAKANAAPRTLLRERH